MFGGILDAIMKSQYSIGAQMGTDAQSAQQVGEMNVNLSNAWMGPSQVAYSEGGPLHALGPKDLTQGYWYEDQNGGWHQRQPVMDSSNMPIGGINYTTNEIQAAIQDIANQESGTSGDALTKLEAARQTWSSESSVMSNMKDLQTSPLTTLAQAESSAIQQDQSASSGSASLGNGMVDLDSITANLVPNIS